MGSASIAMLGIVHEQLTEDNYEYWKVCLKRYLVGQGLWDVVTGKIPQPVKDADDYEDWTKKNAVALHAIQLSCGPDIYKKFRKTTSAKDAWEHLAPSHLRRRDDHEDSGEENDKFHHLSYQTLYNAIENGDWKETKRLLDLHDNAVSARITSTGDTALHVAILAGHLGIAEKLVKVMSVDDLEITNEFGSTALSLAAISGCTKLAKAIVNKNPKSVTISSDQHIDGAIPVIVASLYNRKDMVHYLYKVTPIDELSPERGHYGSTLLHCLISAEIYDVALELLEEYPKLGLTKDRFGKYTLRILAQKPSAFPSGTKLVFWRRWIYSCINVHILPHRTGPLPLSSDEENTRGVQQPPYRRGNIISKAMSLFGELVSGLLKNFVPDLYHRKLVHREALRILSCICKGIPKLSESQLSDIGIDEMIYDAVKHGILEFIVELIKCDPPIIWRKDSKGRTIFAHAIILRQEKIFSLIHGFGTRKNIMAHRHDIFGNNFLHLAAKLSPPGQLERVSGPALQMQRELQWFKEVENMVQPKCKEEVNENSKTPVTLFTEEHKELAKEGERWLKSTAASGMVVGTLIAAVMFTTAFTVPGGNDEKTGLPIFLKYEAFTVFVVSNALSMFAASTSVLMFLGILTARYAEKDFFRSLPMKVIMGLFCLFLSIVTMMVAFGSAIYMTLNDRLSWVDIPVIFLALIPITLFCMLQFPLLIHIIHCTFVSTISSKPKKHPLGVC
ncbi:uncharacterized protein LOC131304233 isoform X1 [Rhododendron vialii]|uniref:uncharacterized protein LOC131304233 isoform X1 n=1 Tax=Rhododendron vialii TaxID=182163 RepID=UPI00265F5309|nr:uncharacterized protein LOC131304233 isoform X1 [Rhododendron vialii]XP_058187370.1 uncharacterized protein LOC131304233 isoform X1 [Rhododendron vialii]